VLWLLLWHGQRVDDVNEFGRLPAVKVTEGSLSEQKLPKWIRSHT